MSVILRESFHAGPEHKLLSIYMLENLIPSPKETKSLLEWRVTLGSHLGGYTITGIELENWSLIPLLWNIWWCRSARQRSYKTLQNQCVIFKF
jgi:hypothetical protein